MTDIIIQAYNVVDEIVKDPDVITLKKMNQTIDKIYPSEIRNFEQAKIAYADVMATGGHYHPDFKEVSQRLSETKTLLYEKPEVKTYIMLEKKVETKLNELLKEMTKRISSHIPTPNAIGIVKKGGSCHVG